MSALAAVNFRILSLCALMIAASGCSWPDQYFSRATVPGSSEWSVIKRCGSGSCYPSNDHVVGAHVTVRVDALNHVKKYIEDGIFLIRVMFPDSQKGDVSFDPSLSHVQMKDQSFKAKGISCSEVTIIDRPTVLSARTILGFQRISPKSYCYFLFFDTSPPSVVEKFILHLGGIRKDLSIVAVPPILFQPGKGQ